MNLDRSQLNDPASVKRGKQLFRQYCVICHGEKADGNGVRSEGLVGDPQDFTSVAWRERVTPEEVYRIIRDGKEGTSMASWKMLGHDKITDLTAYSLSVSEEGP